MSKFKPSTYKPVERSLMKGLLAGLIAGVVATAAKSLAEKIYPPHTHGEADASEALAEKIAGRELNPAQKLAAGKAIHWSFGVLTGAAYGALAEYYPAATAKEGASFGLALAALTHETALPAMGLAPGSQLQTTREHTSEMASHVVYGLVTETVRSHTRRLID